MSADWPDETADRPVETAAVGWPDETAAVASPAPPSAAAAAIVWSAATFEFSSSEVADEL